MFCRNCGRELREGSSFCPECGSPVGAPTTQQVRDRGPGMSRRSAVAVLVFAVLALACVVVAMDMVHEDPEEVLRSLTYGRGADVVMEVAGGKDTFQTAWRIARPNAVVVVVAMYEEPQVLPLPDMYGKNLVFKTGGVDASHCQDIMDMIASGDIDPSVLVTHRFDFDHIMDAYELFAEHRDGVMKVAVKVSDP